LTLMDNMSESLMVSNMNWSESWWWPWQSIKSIPLSSYCFVCTNIWLKYFLNIH
jgi:hypothetical protein